MTLSTKEPTCVNVKVSVLPTVGIGNVMNPVWIINCLHLYRGEHNKHK